MGTETIDEMKKRFAGNDLVCEQIINIFSLLSNKIRFRILCLLIEGEFCVTDIVDIIEIGKISNVSQQLKLLTANGFIQKRRDKRQILYSLKDGNVKDLIAFLNERYIKAGK